jgi:hypothetical protein
MTSESHGHGAPTQGERMTNQPQPATDPDGPTGRFCHWL